MVRVENGVVLYTPYGEEERAIGNLADAEVFEGYLSLGGHGLPLEYFHELKDAWDELYPNGKPVPALDIEPSELIPSDSDIQKAQFEIDTINLLKELGVIPNVE